jgi:nucleotide-binding universal stress UspA family protein
MSLISAALKPRSVLIATDFSETSEKALSYALAIARFYGSKLCLAHVVSSLGLAMAGPDAIAACEQAVRREVADLRDWLLRTGALGGIEHKFIVRQGELWPGLREITRHEGTDLMVVGTHGRHGMGKLFFGSVAEQIFRQADCPVLTVGPHSNKHPWVGTSFTERTFLFATDFGPASLHGLTQAVAVANQFRSRLAFLTVIPAIPSSQHKGWRTVADLRKLREDARKIALQRLAEVAHNAVLDVRPEFHVEFESREPVSAWILETAERLRADLIILGLHDSGYNRVISHLASTTAYDVACSSSSPVLTLTRSSGYEELQCDRPKGQPRLCRRPI